MLLPITYLQVICNQWMMLCLIVNAQNAELDQLKIGTIAFQLTPSTRVKIFSVLRDAYFSVPRRS